MIPDTLDGYLPKNTCPHTRGDDPDFYCKIVVFNKLVPIRVGMIPIRRNEVDPHTTCPHTRGDDPKTGPAMIIQQDLSPYAWG